MGPAPGDFTPEGSTAVEGPLVVRRGRTLAGLSGLLIAFAPSPFVVGEDAV